MYAQLTGDAFLRTGDVFVRARDTAVNDTDGLCSRPGGEVPGICEVRAFDDAG